jgi:hypothetical protein
LGLLSSLPPPLGPPCLLRSSCLTFPPFVCDIHSSYYAVFMTVIVGRFGACLGLKRSI